MKEHPKEVVVLETCVYGTVLTNKNDPVKVAKVLEQAQELLAGDKLPKDTTEMKPNEPSCARRRALAHPTTTSR